MKDMMYNRIVLAFLFSAFSVALFAQADIDEQIKRRAAEKVGQMCDYNDFMANKNNNLDKRRYYREQALNLFIERGDSYEENGSTKEGVLMEVTSVNNQKPRRKLIKVYFTGLINLSYQQVKIKSTAVSNIKVGNLRHIEDNKYECVCYFEQEFIGYRDNKPVYRDITRKSVKCYVLIEEVEGGQEYIILLGDVRALETRRV